MADNNLQATAASLPPVSNKYKEKVSSSLSPPTPDNNKTTTTWIIFLWAMFNAVLFTAMNMARFVLSLKPCIKPTWIFHCVTLTDAAAVEVIYLQCGEELCSAAALQAVAVHMLQKTRTTTTTSRRAAAVVIVLLWVALAATVDIHGMYVASDPGNTVHFHFAFGYVCLALDLADGVLLLSCSPRRRLEQLGEHKGGKDGEV